MKRIFVLAVAAMMTTILCFGQTNAQGNSSEKPFKVFVELIGHQANFFSTKVKVSMDFGEQSAWASIGGKDGVVDESGQLIKFNSMVDALNYMGERGWKFEQAYTVTAGNQNVYHWLMSKEVSDYSEIKTGIQQRADLE